MSEVTFSGNTIGDKTLYLKGMERGTRDEQERIIKLLEGYALAKCDEYCAAKCECFGKVEAMHFIERISETVGIKGGNK